MASVNPQNVTGGSSTPILSSKTLPNSTLLQTQKTGKPAVPTAPRVDYEPLYSALKAGIGDKWHLYGETLALYMRGMFLRSSKSSLVDAPFGSV